MCPSFTLLILLQHYPVSQQFHVFSHDDLSIDADVADFLQAAEQQASQYTINNINACATEAAQR